MVVTRAQVKAEASDSATAIDPRSSVRIKVEPQEAESVTTSPLNETVQASAAKSQAKHNHQIHQDELELSAYEYSLLEERYHALLEEHHQLRQRASDYEHVIWGHARHDSEPHRDAGDGGCRARLSKLDDLMPLFSEVGDVEAFKEKLQYLEDLEEAAGGEGRLEEVVEDAQFLQDTIQKAGGLFQLSKMVDNSNNVGSKQEELQLLDDLRKEAGGHDELLTVVETAQLLRDFIKDAGGLYNFIKMLQDYKLLRLPLEDFQILEELVEEVGGIAKLEELVANAEAIQTITGNAIGQPCLQLLSTIVQDYSVLRSEQREYIALKGLVEGPAGWKVKAQWYDWFQGVLTRNGSDVQPPMLASSARTLPSLPFPPNEAYRAPSWAGTPSQPAALTSDGMKPARAQLLATAPRRNDPLRHLYNPPAPPKPKSTGSNQEPLGKPGDAQHELEGERSTTRKRTNDEQLQPHPMLIKRIREDMQPSNPSPTPAPMPAIVKQEPGLGPLTQSIDVQVLPVLVQKCPIAFWIGPGHPGVYESPRLLSHDQMPPRLARSLATELSRFLNLSKCKVKDMWPAHHNLCVLQYANGESNAFGHGEERRACKNCAVATLPRGPRPCALLQRVNRELTVIFLPLPEVLRPGLTFRDRGFWFASVK